MPKLFVIALLSLLFFLLITPAFAADLQLTYIGSMATNGKTYSQWWYSGSNPSLSGTSLPSSTVDITVDGTKESTNTDSSGNWVYNSALLATGNHIVEIADSQKAIRFTLHSGQTMDKTSSQEASSSSQRVQMPVSGGLLPTMITAMLGITTFGTGLFIKKRAIT